MNTFDVKMFDNISDRDLKIKEYPAAEL